MCRIHAVANGQVLTAQAARAYRKVALDAAAKGADARGLAQLCFEALDNALGAALRHGESGDMVAARRFLARAADALAALRSSLAEGHPLASTFHSLIGTAQSAMARCMARFDTGTLRTIRQDFADIGAAFGAGRN